MENSEAFKKYLKQQGPRERLLEHGAQVLSDSELLAVILRTGHRCANVLSLSAHLIETFGGLGYLLNASKDKLLEQPGLGQTKVSQILSIQELSRRVMMEKMREKRQLNSSHLMKSFCFSKLAHQPVEHCLVLLLDQQYQLIHTQEVSRGSVSSAVVYPRDIAVLALQYQAVHIVLSHNHPSGNLEPSVEDKRLTQLIAEGLRLFDVRLIDHIIVSPRGSVSMAEMGLI